MARLVIFHTSDVHNRLTPERARFLHDLKAGSRGSLMLDSGDAIWAGNVFWRPGGEPVLDLMNEVPYDAMCMGNREFHFLRRGLVSKTVRARFPVLSANLRSIGNWELGIGNCAILRRSGFNVGVFGLSVPSITQRMLVRRIADYYFDDPVEAAREVLPKLRDLCDLVVALTHIGIKRDRELAESVPGIDLILGGHTHTATESPERVRETWILHHGFHCKYVGRVELDTSEGSIEVKNELIPLPGA
jgi:2',3'-cyclic-nucleotide 2'-phosphodiesterase (5'-nucleotidase family)